MKLYVNEFCLSIYFFVPYSAPVQYDEQEKNIKHIFKAAEGYFSLGDKKAYVIPGRVVDGSQEVEIKYGPESKAKKMVLGAIKIVSYMTGIIPLIMLVVKTVFRGTHKFHTIPTVTLLQDGIDIKEETVLKIQTCMEKILERKEKGRAHLYSSHGSYRVFSLDSEPSYVFKMDANKNIRTVEKDGPIQARYKKIILAKTICRMHDLGLLVIPNAKLFTVNVAGDNYDIIAEKKVDINPDERDQEKLFEDHANDLNETIRQLSVFIAKSGFSDVERRNIPVVNNVLDQDGKRKIALIDIETMDGAKIGLFGDPPWIRGLVRCCVNKKQIDIVIEEACKHGVVYTKAAKTAKELRLEELEFDEQLKQFYKTKNISNGSEPIQVDLESLGLDLEEKGKVSVCIGIWNNELLREERTFTMKEVVQAVIEKMNALIQKSSVEKSVKGKRDFVLNTNHPPLVQYIHLGLPLVVGRALTAEEEKQSWLYRIIQALVDQAYIFKFDKVSGLGYSVQA